MTEEDLARLEALHRESTEGTWVYRPEVDHWDSEHGEVGEVVVVGEYGDTVMSNQPYYPHDVSPADMRFCAEAHEAIPALIAELRRLKAEAA